MLFGGLIEPAAVTPGINFMLEGGVLVRGEQLSLRSKLRSYTTLEPPGVVPYILPPGVWLRLLGIWLGSVTIIRLVGISRMSVKRLSVMLAIVDRVKNTVGL